MHTGPCTNVWYLLQQLPLPDHAHIHKACVVQSLCFQRSCCICAAENEYAQSEVWVTAPWLLTSVAYSCCLLLLLTPGCLLVLLFMEVA